MKCGIHYVLCLSACVSVCSTYTVVFMSQPMCLCAVRHVFCVSASVYVCFTPCFLSLSQCVCVSLSTSVPVCCTPCSVSLSQPVRLCASGVQPGQVQHAGVSSAGLSLLSGSFGLFAFSAISFFCFSSSLH